MVNAAAVRYIMYIYGSFSMTALKYNVHVEAFYIPGYFNDIADSLSLFYMPAGANTALYARMSLLHEGQRPMPNGY